MGGGSATGGGSARGWAGSFAWSDAQWANRTPSILTTNPTLLSILLFVRHFRGRSCWDVHSFLSCTSCRPLSSRSLPNYCRISSFLVLPHSFLTVTASLFSTEIGRTSAVWLPHPRPQLPSSLPPSSSRIRYICTSLLCFLCLFYSSRFFCIQRARARGKAALRRRLGP